MYIDPGQGQTTPVDKILMSTENLSLRSFATSLKKISLKSNFIHFFFIFLSMYIAPGRGLTTLWGQNFDVNRNILSLRSFVASSPKNLFEVCFYTIFFMILYMYIVPGQGQTAPKGQNFDVNRKALSLYPFLQVSKKSLWSLILYNFFSWFNTCT